MNSGVHEAYNLCWKIKAVLDGVAGESLLDTYELERRPVALKNVEAAVNNAQHHFLIDRAFGLAPTDEPETNWARIERLWASGAEADELRRGVAQAISAQRIGFRHHNIEVGSVYKDGAIMPDRSPEPIALDSVMIYQPSTRPGHPLPHAMIESVGSPFPISQLTNGGLDFALIAGEEGDAWIEAARVASLEFGISIKAVRIGLYSGDYRDTRGAWLKQREIDRDGAILVRPDRYVAFRACRMVIDPTQSLKAALSKILRRQAH